MTDEQARALADAIAVHGDQLARNFVHLKKFTAAQNEAQQEFLKKLQDDNEAMQSKSLKAARLSAFAAVMAAIAAVASALVPLLK